MELKRIKTIIEFDDKERDNLEVIINMFDNEFKINDCYMKSGSSYFIVTERKEDFIKLKEKKQ